MDRTAYLRWKRANVTLRGVRDQNDNGSHNGVFGSFGKGLYTAFLSNKGLAREYGSVKFVVGAIPKRPKTVQDRNAAEILVQGLVDDFCKEHGERHDRAFFDGKTTVEDEMAKRGFDGLVIRGREMVNYVPGEVLYFSTERQLESYYETCVEGSQNESAFDRYMSAAIIEGTEA